MFKFSYVFSLFNRFVTAPLKARIPSDESLSLADETPFDKSASDQNVSLSVQVEDANFLNVPFPVLCEIFREAAQLVSSGMDIFPLPGLHNDNLFQVQLLLKVKVNQSVRYVHSCLRLVVPQQQRDTQQCAAHCCISGMYEFYHILSEMPRTVFPSGCIPEGAKQTLQ